MKNATTSSGTRGTRRRGAGVRSITPESVASDSHVRVVPCWYEGSTLHRLNADVQLAAMSQTAMLPVAKYRVMGAAVVDPRTLAALSVT